MIEINFYGGTMKKKIKKLKKQLAAGKITVKQYDVLVRDLHDEKAAMDRENAAAAAYETFKDANMAEKKRIMSHQGANHLYLACHTDDFQDKKAHQKSFYEFRNSAKKLSSISGMTVY